MRSTAKKRMSSLTYVMTAAMLLFLITSCDRQQSSKPGKTKERYLMATLYHQVSPEMTALIHQSYNIADMMVHAELAKTGIDLTRKRAIITDIDETVLDNSPYEAMCILEGKSYPEGWDEWVNLSSARPLPGSQHFFNYAAGNDIEIFYVTNRKEHNKEATLVNLQRFGFPNADEEHLIMRTGGSSKDQRRLKIQENYRVVLLLGDNLEDFATAFENDSNLKKKEYIDKLQASFGRRFIIFPNAMYGSWVKSVEKAAEKDSTLAKSVDVMRHALTAY